MKKTLTVATRPLGHAPAQPKFLLFANPDHQLRIFLMYFVAMLLSIGLANAQSTVPKNFLLGRFEPARDTSFCRVDHIYTDRAVYLKKTVYTAYKRMYAAALKDGIKLNIISGTRTFNDQCYKWGSKWTAGQFAHLTDKAARSEQLLRWWSMPGTSRHHWGTDMDLVNLTLAFFRTTEGKRVYNWLATNAPKYGFQQPFNAGRTTGYQEEKWHWSYVPLAKTYLTEYVKQISYRDINGFRGCEAAQKLDVINTRVLAVNGACR